MRPLPLLKQVILGVLIAFTMLTATPVQAQFGGVVYDPSAYHQRELQWLEHKEEEVKKKLEKFEHWAKEAEHWANELSTLQGVLGRAEKLVLHNAHATANLVAIAHSIRGVLNLKALIESTVRIKIAALKRIRTRLTHGIFDPNQDWQDFEEYLKYSIGRSAEDKVADMDRLARMDNEYDKLRTDLQMAREKLAQAQADLIAATKTLKTLTDLHQNDAAIVTDKELAEEMQRRNTLEQIVATWTAECNRLEEKIEEKVKKYGIRLKLEENFGAEITKSTEAWEKATDVKEEIIERLYNYGYGNPPPTPTP